PRRLIQRLRTPRSKAEFLDCLSFAISDLFRFAVPDKACDDRSLTVDFGDDGPYLTLMVLDPTDPTDGTVMHAIELIRELGLTRSQTDRALNVDPDDFDGESTMRRTPSPN